MKSFILRWIRHSALNVGDGVRLAWAVINCILFAILPPQLHHSTEELRGLDRSSTWQEFLRGLLDRD